MNLIKNHHSIYAILLGILIVSTPWPQIYFDIYHIEMNDRYIYIIQAEAFALITDYFDYFEWTSYITHEFLWGSTLGFVTRDLGVDIETLFFIFSVSIVFLFIYIVFRQVGWVATLFILNPLIIDFAFSQLRLAVAIFFLSLAYLVKPKSLKISILLLVLTPFIHTASILFVFIYFAAYFTDEKYFKVMIWRLLALVFIGLIIGLAIGPFREIILSSVNDRRSEYQDISSSNLYLMYWMMLFGTLLFQYQNSMKTFELRYSICILSIIFVNVIFSGYSSRFLAASFPFLIIAIWKVDQRKFSSIQILFAVYVVFQWAYWFRLL
ncbi:MAG: hypothetical protein COB24_00045 [Hyphomicrobiales bacterium]|nr:MAG: hypothetical protein COB24_00045 [Hyphomicrobiales bacterium]